MEEIAEGLAETFGEEAEPVLPRLVKYLQIVEANGWVRMKGNPDSKMPRTSKCGALLFRGVFGNDFGSSEQRKGHVRSNPDRPGRH